MGKLKNINFETGVFEANGVTYRIESGLSIERYCEFQVLEKELAYGMDFKALYGKMVKINSLMNNVRFTEVAVLINDIMRGISKVEEREPAVLKICTLFINTEDEDRAVISNDMMLKKMSDWKTEGISMKDFFTVALNSVNGFLEVYARLTQGITPMGVLTTEDQVKQG